MRKLALLFTLLPPLAFAQEQAPQQPGWPPQPPPPDRLPELQVPPLDALLPSLSFKLELGVGDALGGLLSTAFLLALFIAAQRVEDDVRKAVALGGAVVLMLGLLLGNTGMLSVGAVALAVAAALALS